MDRATMQVVYKEIERQQDIAVDCNVDAELESLRVRLEKLEDEATDKIAAATANEEEWKVIDLDHSCPTGVHSDLLDCNC